MSHLPTLVTHNSVRIPASTSRTATSRKLRAAPKKPTGLALNRSAKLGGQDLPASTPANAIPVAEVLKSLALAQANSAASAALGDLKRQAEHKLEEKSPRVKAVIEAVGPHAAGLIALTAKELANDPETIKKLAQLSTKVGKEGFTKAMKALGPEASRAFAKAAGMEAMNPVVVAKLLESLPRVAAKVSPKLATKVAKQCVALEVKLGVKTIVKTGATAGKIAPAVGNAIAVASTTLAAASLIKSLGSKDPEKICKEGCNTLLQAVGIAFPWVALGGDLVDLGWTAKMAIDDKPDAKASTAHVQDSGKLISAAATAASEQASGAGNSALAKALADFSNATKDVSSRKQIEKSSQEALKRLAQSASSTFSEQAKVLPEGSTKKESELLAEAFGELFKIVLHHQKSPKVNDAKRVDDAGALLDLATKVNKD